MRNHFDADKCLKHSWNRRWKKRFSDFRSGLERGQTSAWTTKKWVCCDSPCTLGSIPPCNIFTSSENAAAEVRTHACSSLATPPPRSRFSFLKQVSTISKLEPAEQLALFVLVTCPLTVNFAVWAGVGLYHGQCYERATFSILEAMCLNWVNPYIPASKLRPLDEANPVNGANLKHRKNKSQYKKEYVGFRVMSKICFKCN